MLRGVTARLPSLVPTALAFGLVAACDGGGSRSAGDAANCDTTVPLVDHTLWTVLGPSDDPFGGGPRRCGPEDLVLEDFSGESSLSVSTRRCSWMTVTQPSLAPLHPGDALNVRLWYFSQTLFDAAEATLVVEVGEIGGTDGPGSLRWTTTVPLPTPSALAYDTLPVSRELPAGTPIWWHVHNHGENTWNLIEVSVTRSVTCGR